MQLRPFLFSVSLAALVLVSHAANVDSLTCEYLSNPLGIDVTTPRLSWKIRSNARGEKQTAYQILVASSAKLLDANKGDLWDSGKVATSDSNLVDYAGTKLTSQTKCFWKVKVWDAKGVASEWSKPALWTMGLLAKQDWKGKWIGYDHEDGPQASIALQDSKWIWTAEGDPTKSAPAGDRYFRLSFKVANRQAARKAIVTLAVDNIFELRVNGKLVAKGDNFRDPQSVDITQLLQNGKNEIWVKGTNELPNPSPAGLIANLKMEMIDGKTITLNSGASWESSVDGKVWAKAKELGAYGIGPWGRLDPDLRILPARYLRKEFSINKKIESATASISGLGLFELQLNGQKVGDHVLEPGLTEYDKRAMYITFDVTRQLGVGKNAIGVILGNGRYYAMRSHTPVDMRTFGLPKLLMQIDVTYADGSKETITSDQSWKLTTDGPIRANNEYDGEVYDATKNLTGWSNSGFNDAKWIKPELVDGPKGEIVAQMNEPIRVTDIVTPKSVKEVRPGVFVYDMGQNMVGWCQLKVKGRPGQSVKMRFAESVTPKGELYTENLRSAQATDTYTIGSAAVETYEPRFTYHGFQFVEVTGYPGRPDLNTIVGHVVHDDLPRSGHFESSNTLLNKIAHNVFWGVRGNYHSIITDCPQRDERHGWTGDRAAESLGEASLFNISTIYSKWLDDIRDAQQADGSLPDVAPAYWWFYNNNVTWPSLAVIVPGTLYDMYGDKRVLEKNYDMMKRWVEHMDATVKNGITTADTYGDWCAPPEKPELIHSQDPARKTSGALLATSYHYHNLMLLARYAKIIGKPADAVEFETKASVIANSFNSKFYKSETGTFDNGSQTSSILPLFFGLTPADQEDKVFKQLVDKIENKTPGMIGTGLIGGQWLMRTLSDHGRADIAYKMATRTTYPSWGYMIEKGATTIWELWNGDTANPAMNSRNHVMLIGDLYIWMNQYLAGIRPDPDQPGFKHFVIHPVMPGDLQWVKGDLDSQYGLIKSEWKKTGKMIEISITVPANTTATVVLPTKDASRVTESGTALATSKGVSGIRVESGTVKCEVGGGEYKFLIKS